MFVLKLQYIQVNEYNNKSNSNVLAHTNLSKVTTITTMSVLTTMPPAEIDRRAVIALEYVLRTALRLFWGDAGRGTRCAHVCERMRNADHRMFNMAMPCWLGKCDNCISKRANF